MSEKILKVNRRELKYQLDYHTLNRLLNSARNILNPDEFMIGDSYQVISLYFDTPNRDDLYDKINGVSNKHKLRLRIYNNDDSFIKLELKTKIGQYQNKRSLKVEREEACLLINGNAGFLLDKGKFGLELYEMIRVNRYRPSVIVEYKRQAFKYKHFNTRVTFDSNIESIKYFV